MKKLNATHTESETRQNEIIQAALSCFTEKGFTDTSVADICRKSRASTGSLYHHFKSKSHLAAAVYLSGIRDYQRGMMAVLSEEASAKAGIFKVVSFHLEWVDAHREWARFLFQHRYAEFMGDIEEEMNQMNGLFFSKMAAWFQGHIEKGHFRDLPREIFISLLMGPCQEFARHSLSLKHVSLMAQAAEQIAQGVWAALGIRDEPV